MIEKEEKAIHARELVNDPDCDWETLICEKQAYRQNHPEDGGIVTSDGGHTGSVWLPMKLPAQIAFFTVFQIAQTTLDDGFAFIQLVVALVQHLGSFASAFRSAAPVRF